MAKAATKTTGGKVGRPPGRKPAQKRKPGANGESAGVIRVNFDISRADHTKLKIYAAKTGCSMADILRAFVSGIKTTGK